VRLFGNVSITTNLRTAGAAALLVLRSWDFERCAPGRAFRRRVPRLARDVDGRSRDSSLSRDLEHVKGYRVIANDALLDQGDDWTERLQLAVADG
jgi:hypothetical protein